MLESTVMLAIVGVLSALVALIAKILNELLSVIKSNTETNAKVQEAINGFVRELGDHDHEVQEYLEQKVTPALLKLDELITLLRKG